MNNVAPERRWVVIVLVVLTIAIFIGFVWVIATYLPLDFRAMVDPSPTTGIAETKANCAAPVEYWKEHPDLYPTKIVIGDQVYLGSEISAIFDVQPDDLTGELRAQLATAYLNISAGADQSYIEATVFQAYSWLVDHPVGSQVSDDEREEGKRLFDLLEAYNQGLTGVAACEGMISQPATGGAAIGTAGVELIITVTSTRMEGTSETSTPSSTSTSEPIYTGIAPSRTPVPTTQAPRNTTPTPTRTNVPSPTNTAVRTTVAPTATNTLAPTFTPTLPSTPTNTPTIPSP